MTMTKKDYELIAKILNKNIHDKNPRMTEVRYSANRINEAMAYQFADILSTHDLRFNRHMFLESCGVGDIERPATIK